MNDIQKPDGAFINPSDMDLSAIARRGKWLAEIERRWIEDRNTNARWQVIRDAYAKQMPLILEYAKHDARISPYFIDWDFTPIERFAWMDIRGRGLPFFPQVPALNYFIDFAEPYRKIGIELDGRQFHNKEKDTARDERLWAEGWRIFRIPGFKSLPCPAPVFDNGWMERYSYEPGEFLQDLRKWACNWSEGIFWAIQTFYFTPRQKVDNNFLFPAFDALDQNRYVDFPIELQKEDQSASS